MTPQGPSGRTPIVACVGLSSSFFFLLSPFPLPFSSSSLSSSSHFTLPSPSLLSSLHLSPSFSSSSLLVSSLLVSSPLASLSLPPILACVKTLSWKGRRTPSFRRPSRGAMCCPHGSGWPSERDANFDPRAVVTAAGLGRQREEVALTIMPAESAFLLFMVTCRAAIAAVKMFHTCRSICDYSCIDPLVT